MTGVSILIPCFNAAKFIATTLRSVLHEIDAEDEIIVVDDGSIDRSAEIAHEILATSFGKHQVVRNPGKGACMARNYALSISKNALIQWLDADDILAPNKITIHRDLLSRNPTSLIVSPFIPFIDNPSTGIINEERCWDLQPESTPADWLASGVMTIPASWMGHRSTFEKAGPWDERLKVNQDGEYFARAIATADKIIFEPKTNVWCRRGLVESVSHFTPQKAEALFNSVDSLKRTALTVEESPRMRQMLANNYQRAIFTAYPYFPEGIRRAQDELRNLPKPTISNPNAVSPLSKFISATLGWKTVSQARIMRSRMKS